MENQPASKRSPAVWVVGLTVLVALWLPPLPWTLHAADLPPRLRDLCAALKLFKSTETWRGRWDYFLFPPLFLYALVATWRSRASAAECGFTFRYFTGALRLLLLPTFLGAAVLILLGLAAGSIDARSFAADSRFWKRLIPLNALVQQTAIQVFFHRQLMPWFGPGQRTAGALTLFFVAIHTPNPGLMLGTGLGMYFWARCYQRQPNLYALALSHAVLSALLMQTMPPWLLPSVSVGHRFLEKVMGW